MRKRGHGPRLRLRRRRRERGAALVMSLLISLLMLAAGGALLMATGRSASNASDSTAETQAYYAAEAGLQSAMSVVRGNRNPTVAGTDLTFRKLLCGNANPCTNSDGNGATGNMGLWLPRTNGVVSLAASPPMAYTITLRDAGLAEGAAVAATYEPRYLVITSRGHGPKGATKVLRMMVDSAPFDFTARAGVAIRSHDDNEPMEKLGLGSSNPHEWDGDDNASPPAAGVPAFAVTNTADYDAGDGFGRKADGNVQGTAEGAINGDSANVLGPQQLVKLNPNTLEWWLRDANSARAFIAQQRERALAMGRHNPSDYGTAADPKFSFIDGNIELKGGDHYAGLMIVTGTFSMGGSSSFRGLLIALGGGRVERNGTPDLFGALVLGKFGSSGDFLSPYLDSAGGGNSTVGYDSEWVRKALASGGPRVVGIVEQ